MAENQEVPAGMKRALEILTSVLQAANGDYLEKSMLIVPDVEADSDETQKRDALTKLLETLASDDPGLSLSDENIADVKAFFEKLYGGQVKFRQDTRTSATSCLTTRIASSTRRTSHTP